MAKEDPLNYLVKRTLCVFVFVLSICHSPAILAAGCKDDSDCKGGRTCQDGSCVASAKSGCTKDTDCKGERICENGKCVDPGGDITEYESNAPFQRQQFNQAIFCCDSFGNRRCQLFNQVPEGTGCFCVGQGWGIACR